MQWLFNYDDDCAGSNYTGDLAGTNFVTMSVAAIPEPSTLALLHGLRRRRIANLSGV